MDYFVSQVENLAKTASELTVYDIKSAVKKVTNQLMNLSPMETTVREATNDDAWGASSTVMQEIAQATFNFQLFNEIMPCIYQRFTEKEARQWRQIYKSLVLLEYLVKNGSERVIDDARTHLSLIKVLRNFHYTDEAGKDQGINVRNRSKELAELLSDLDKVRTERRKAKANRSKYTGTGNDGSGGGGGPSFQSAGGSRYGGFGSDSFVGGSGGGGGSSSGAGSGSGRGSSTNDFQDTGGRGGDFEEYDAGDSEDGDRRAPSRSQSSSSRSSAKATAPPPKATPKAPEVNLFDFDDDEQQPAVPAKFTPSASALEDDFDDFQSAPSFSPASPAAPSAHQNVFDLLKVATPAPSLPNYQQPMSNFAPLVAQTRPLPLSQPGSFTSATLTPTVRPAQATSTAPKPASDFSDLFSSFGATPASSSSSSAGTAGKPSMAQLAAQTRQDSLFGNKAGQQKQGGGSDWDSLI